MMVTVCCLGIPCITMLECSKHHRLTLIVFFPTQNIIMRGTIVATTYLVDMFHNNNMMSLKQIKFTNNTRIKKHSAIQRNCETVCRK
jgi:hypothetical protein